MSKKVTVKNFEKVLENIKELYKSADSSEKKVWCTDLNKMLDQQAEQDFFGTEGQTDPRDDWRK